MRIRSSGSVQRKSNGLYYFVTRDGGGRQKWIALGTRLEAEARARAAGLAGAPGAEGGRRAWLEYLARIGREAERELSGAGPVDAPGWGELFGRWTRCADELTDNRRTLEGYEGQTAALARWAAERGAAGPEDLTREAAQEFVRGRPPLRQKRDVALFSRMWRELGMDAGVWSGIAKARAVGVPFRRLELREVRALVAALESGTERQPSAAGEFVRRADLADLVRLGYSTGLRRQDAALLDAAALDPDAPFLSVVAGKTRHSAARALTVPLTEEAEAVARRRAQGGGPLFPELAGASFDKALRLAFRRAGVLTDGRGKASFHSLRATFVSLMDEAGVQGYITDAVTGHRREGGMHGHYSQPSREVLLREVRRAVPPLDV